MSAIPSSRLSAAPFVSSKASAPGTRTPAGPKSAASVVTTPSSGLTRPLAATKVVLGTGTERRRSVAFSAVNQTKEFVKDSPIVPEPPQSIRSYSPAISSPLPSSDRGSSPSGPRRPILKASDPSSIRVARTLREGSWANREPARRLVVGNRPRGMAARSGSLAQLCDTAEDGVAGRVPSEDDVPASDDSTGQVDAPSSEGSDEEPEEVECLHPTSLVSVILEGTEDLLTLEEAYCTLTAKVREVPSTIGPVSEAVQRQLDNVVEPISDEAPALVRAMTRDLSRLMGKVPQSEHSHSSTPFRGLQPASRSSAARLPPSPTTTPSKKGYSEAEIRYRREASSVGAAVLRFLAALFSSPRLFNAFSEADLVALLEQVVMIPRTPVLPTPIPKRTYSLALSVLAHLAFPSSWVARVRGRILASLDSAWNTLGNGGPQYTFKDSSAVKREAFQALSALIRAYPEVMVPGYTSYLATSLRALSAVDSEMRRNASGCVAAFVKARYQLVADAEVAVRFDGEDDAQSKYEELRALVHKTEQHTVNFFKSMAKPSPKRYCDIRPDKMQTRQEWIFLESAFKALIGTLEGVAWGCSTWAVVATLMGTAYNSFPLVYNVDHIMDRSLMPSTNSIRPVLACTAWQHAIHAYLLAGSSCSVSNGRLVRSFNPFSASAALDASARVEKTMFPFRNAMIQALSKDNFSRSLVEFPEFRNEQRWTWKRNEKPRKAAYILTTGSIAPAIVYAYTTVALDHEEQAAKVVSRLSGLPSSDGNIPDLTPEEQRLPRLDQTFELVLLPILKQSFPVCGIDVLKNQAWSIFEAVTNEPPAQAPRRSIDRLLSWRYFNGDIVSFEATEPAMAQEVVRAFESDRIKPSEIPSWGKLWVAKRLGKLLTLFLDAFDGMNGISNLSSVEWVCNSDGIVLLPQTLSRVWTNLLRAMLITHVPDGPATPLFKVGLYAITKTLIDIFDRDPASYMPICLLTKEGQSALSLSAIRLGVVTHLFRVAEEVLGESALGTVQFESPAQSRSQDDDEAFGHPTVAGHLLKHILRSRLDTQTMDDKTRVRLSELVASLLRIGSAQNTRMLGHVANTMPWIFESHERLQLDVWRTLSLAWISAVDLQPADKAAKTNHTGDLLVSLLSCPFRNDSADSVWYNSPTDEDLAAWDALLETTVLRFRARRVGSNFGVLETLAAHLQDFITPEGDDEAIKRRLTSPTALRCLAVASTSVSFVPTEHYHASHYSINENFVPVDFLTLVGSALESSYPSAADKGAVARLIGTISGIFRALPADSVPEVLKPLRAPLVLWLLVASTPNESEDADELAKQLDQLYIAVLGALSLAIESGRMPASSRTMNSLIDIYAPRLSCAHSAAVPAAFQDFWRRSFQSVAGLEYSDDVAGFLQDVLTAVPGLIVAEGLSSDESISASVDRFPFAESVPSQIVERTVASDEEAPASPIAEPTAEPEGIVPASQEGEDEDENDLSKSHPEVHGEVEEEADEAVDKSLDDAAPSPHPTEANPSTDYDADVSQTQRSQPIENRKRKSEVLIDSSPSTAGSPDVFGPKKRTKSSKSSRRRTRSKAARSREMSSMSSPASSHGEVGNDTVIPGTDIEDEGEPTPSRPPREAQAQSRESLLGRFFRRVPSIGAFFNGEQHAEHSVGHVDHVDHAEFTDLADFELEDTDVDEDDSEHVGNNTYDESTHEDMVEETREEAVALVEETREDIVVEETREDAVTLVEETPEEQVESAESEVIAAVPAEMAAAEADEPADEPAPSPAPVAPAPERRSTRRSHSKQPTPSLEATQVDNSQEASQSQSQRRRSRRVANQPPAEREPEIPRSTRSRSRASASVEPAVLAPPPAEPEPSPEPETQSQRSTRSSARRKRASEPPENAAPAKRLRPSVSAPVEPTKDARALRRERRQRTSKAASAGPSTIEEAVEAEAVVEVQEPEPEAEQEAIEVEPVEVEPVAEPSAEMAEPVEAEEPVEPVMEHIEVEAPAEPEPEIEQEPIEIDGPDASAIAEEVAAHIDIDDAPHHREHPADRTEAIPSAFQDAPSYIEHRSAFEDAPSREAIPSAFQDAPTPAPPSVRVQAPPPTPEEEEDEEEVERLTKQSRLLAALDEIASDETTLANLDLNGVNGVLAYARRLQDAATATMAAFAREGEASRLRRTRTL